MRGLEDVVLLGVDQRRLLLGVLAPQQEHEALPAGAQQGDGCVCEALPALLAVAGRVVRPHRQHRVEQEHPLVRPLRRRRNCQPFCRLLRMMEMAMSVSISCLSLPREEQRVPAQ